MVALFIVGVGLTCGGVHILSMGKERGKPLTAITSEDSRGVELKGPKDQDGTGGGASSGGERKLSQGHYMSAPDNGRLSAAEAKAPSGKQRLSLIHI